MSYGLTFEDDPAESVERVRREQLEAAAEVLDADEDPVEAIHDARKRIKKTRALLRLARPGMKPKAYRRLNRALRDTGRGMSGSRDADVLVETVDDLAERFARRAPKTFFAGVRQPLANHAQALRKDADAVGARRGPARTRGGRVAAARPRRRRARRRAQADLRPRPRGLRAADRKPTTTNLHEWRKRVKDLWYQQRLLEDTWPGVMKAQAKEAKKLSKLLGEDHDLAVLAEHVADDQLHAMIDVAPRRAARAVARPRPAHLRRAPEGVRAPLAPLRGPRRLMEVERKYVLAARPDGLDDHESGRLEQGYLALDPAGAEVRVRRKGAKHTLTVKTGAGLVRGEEEVALDAADFDRLWPLTEGRRVVKTRYLVPLDGGLTAEVDVYEGALDGLLTAEVEFPDEAAAHAFAAPEWLGEDVTGDKRYANQRAGRRRQAR